MAILAPNFIKRLVYKFVDKLVLLVLARYENIQWKNPLAFVPPEPEPTAVDPDVRNIRIVPYVFKGTVAPQTITSKLPHYFLVTSQGLAGSAWLASSLNLHPEITCSMGIDHPLVSMRYYYTNEEIQRKMEGVDSIEQIKYGFYQESLRSFFIEMFAEKGIDLRDKITRENPVRDLQKMYNELSIFFPGNYFGNVHSCFAAQAIEYLSECPTRRDVTLMNLIRHPVARTEAAIKGVLSVATHYQDSDWHTGITEGIDAFTEANPDMRRDREARFGVDFSVVRNRAVLYSYYRALHNECWAGEIMHVPTACHVTMDRLISDPDHFSWLVWELTGRAITPSHDYLDKVFKPEHLSSGRHTGKGRSATPRETYEQWSDWEKYEFKLALERLNIPEVYAPFGFDFSFVK